MNLYLKKEANFNLINQNQIEIKFIHLYFISFHSRLLIPKILTLCNCGNLAIKTTSREIMFTLKRVTS